MHIKLQNLTHYFDEDKCVLDDISFEDECQSLAIIGHSGSGKSTLLRILSGLIYPTSGKLFFNHQEISLATKSQWQKKIGVVFQHNGLFPHLTGFQNIILPLVEVFDMSYDEAESKATYWLERFGLAQESFKYPHQLSGGQQQRIAIIRAVIVQPELLILDEPTSSLDPEYTSEVLQMVHDLTLEGQNIILVTHEMGFARRSCEKTMFVLDGKISEYNTSEQLFQNPQTSELKSFLNKILEWK